MLKQVILLPFKVGYALFWLGWWCFGLTLLFLYLMRWWPGDSFLPVQILNYFMPWLLLALLPGLILAVLGRKVKLIPVLLAPTVLIGLAYLPLFLPRTTPALATNTQLKVMSFNINRWNTNINQLTQVISQENPDILLLQEVRLPTLDHITNQLSGVYDSQLYVTSVPEMQQTIVSRYPITPIGTDYHEGQVQKVIIDTPAGPVEVWNVHASQPVLWRKHYSQLTNLAESAKMVTIPLIVAGDFNTTDQSEVYRQINAVVHNAHWEAGWGFGFSFPVNKHRLRGMLPLPAMVRIDHIFYNDHFFATSAGTVHHAAGSDHRPVVATLQLTQ